MSATSFDSLESTYNSSSSPESLSHFNLSPYQKVALFDWDDTLFCTKYMEIHELNYNEIFSCAKSLEDFGSFLTGELKELENTILELFDELIEKEVAIYIVSNADGKWIENCLIHFLPDLFSYLTQNEIKIYSAKNLFCKKFSVEKWKPKCFKKVLMENFTDKSTKLEILSIGDSNDEKMAAIELSSFKFYERIKVKFVEMIKGPSISSIIAQLNFIKENFDSITQSKSFLHKLSFEHLKSNQMQIVDIESKEKKRKLLNRKRKYEDSISSNLLFEQD